MKIVEHRMRNKGQNIETVEIAETIEIIETVVITGG
jgi:hypothetical protein